ncbi:LOW QUALITY PROTEIN: uncharacterized protein FAM215A [Hylobates moloch]|uniref:LOW QUALITY PROTEIN: uncharacterized protein FAM215A n=1 Tax=Hylobates moloch TaxID=81572 RepID=UPI00136344E2|nr:LOW QUALITY PROTEIN: uncharacterized protein FAM215A [Hylobates moloch]
MVLLWVEGTFLPPGFGFAHVACSGRGMKQKRKAASSEPTSQVALGGSAGPVLFHLHPEGLLWCSHCFFSLGPKGTEEPPGRSAGLQGATERSGRPSVQAQAQGCENLVPAAPAEKSRTSVGAPAGAVAPSAWSLPIVHRSQSSEPSTLRARTVHRAAPDPLSNAIL